jgi:Icc-related predicted phosphoesterase
VLVIDMDVKRVRTLKTSSELQPKPRRRACVNFIGNCMLMFGGFNSEYFNDLHYINVTELHTKPKRYVRNFGEYEKLINVKEYADY